MLDNSSTVIDWKCKICGETFKVQAEFASKGVRHSCKNVDIPSFTDRAKHYANAIFTWHKNGRPVRTDKEVQEIFEQHCKSCHLNKNGICAHCGCAVSLNKVPLLNKIKMKTESCPLKRW